MNLWRTLLASVAIMGWLGAAHAACTADDFGATVDSAGAALRAYNLEAAPKLQGRIKALAAKKGWTDQESEDNAIASLQDDRIAKLDATSNELLAKIDTLGRLEPGKAVDCAQLDDLKTAGIELLAVMKAKSTYIISKIDSEVAIKGSLAAQVKPTAVPPSPTKAPQPAVETSSPVPAPPIGKSEPATATTATAAPPPAPQPIKKPEAEPTWHTATTGQTVKPTPPTPSSEIAMVAPPIQPLPNAATSSPRGPRPSEGMVRPPIILEPDDGYTIDEIRDATRGFFGTVSTSLAAVIEHAFQSAGRPTGYILGQEGGGAFLGGLRYGDGILYGRTGGTQKIFWHGPSVGLDVGAAGARTLMLVYQMREPSDLYRVFTGLDGSAFVVGGVGVTLLGGGGMTLAPIRSGLGVRVGANVGYLRFTPTQTWNPF